MRWFSAAILASCLGVAGLGLAMGLHLERGTEPSPSPASSDDPVRLAPIPIASVDPRASTAPTSSSATLTFQARAAAREAPASAEPGSDAVLPPATAEPPPSPHDGVPPAAIEPETTSSAAAEPAAAVTVAALSAATAMPARPHRTVQRRYWVEYAVFAHKRAAERLRHRLAALQVEASVVATHGRDARRLWRVRSAVTERTAAEASVRLVRQNIGIDPLIHHHGAPSQGPRGQYWVQFGVFPTIAPAVELQRVLVANGVKATVRSTRTSVGKPLFLVRSEGFPDRRLALLVGELGGSAAKVAFLIGRSSSRHAAAHGRDTPSASGSSLPRHHHRDVPRPGSG